METHGAQVGGPMRGCLPARLVPDKGQLNETVLDRRSGVPLFFKKYLFIWLRWVIVVARELSVGTCGI